MAPMDLGIFAGWVAVLSASLILGVSVVAAVSAVRR